MTIIQDVESLKPERPLDDGYTCYGPDPVLMRHCTYDWRSCPKEDQDEAVSGVDGAVLTLSGVVILGSIKAILAGNGDHPINDVQNAHWHLQNCFIMEAGRRCPEAQDGTTVTMRNCWVHNWGAAFDVRAFGAWAHRGSRIIAEDCLFTQSGGLFSLGVLNTLRDVGNHIGQAVNDSGLSALLKPRTYMPGVCRGLTADTGGLVLATRCYRNKPWIVLDNCDSYLDRDAAQCVVQEINAAIPDFARGRLGMDLVQLFNAVC